MSAKVAVATGTSDGHAVGHALHSDRQQPATKKSKGTHGEVFVAPTGDDKIFTVRSATSPSTAFVPFAPTDR
jgi:hypothetical protein